MSKIQKYRPYLTLTDLKTLLGYCRSQSPGSDLSTYLNRYIFEIESGFRGSNTLVEPTLEQKLGFAPLPEAAPVISALEQSEQFRYINNQMSPAEELDYEKRKGRII